MKKQQKNKRKKAKKREGWQTDKTARLDAPKMPRREAGESGAALMPEQYGSNIDFPLFFVFITLRFGLYIH